MQGEAAQEVVAAPTVPIRGTGSTYTKGILICSSHLFPNTRHALRLTQSTQDQCTSAWLNHNSHPTIIIEIIHVNFPNLKMLQLSQNMIRSIEVLQNLRAPNLNELHLSFNQIVEFRSLRKCSFPFLEKLSVMNNPIQLFDCMLEWNFPKLKMVLLEDYRNNSSLPHRILFGKHKFAKMYPPKQVTIRLTSKTKDSKSTVHAKLSKVCTF